MKRFYFTFYVLPLFLLFISCQKKEYVKKNDTLFVGFQNPPVTSRPFVRWWWNGNCLRDRELKREIKILHKAGFGGVEINPIAMPGEASLNRDEPVVWLSKKWIELLGITAETLHQNRMTMDLLVGSGWPFGGEFLKEDQTIQSICPIRKKYKDGDMIDLQVRDLYNPARNETLLFLSLVPTDASNKQEVIDLLPLFNEKKSLHYAIPVSKNKIHRAEFELIAGVWKRNYTKVGLGAPGAAGPVMNHYRKEIVFAYLNRLKRISEYLGRPLSELISALFCDSIELSGSNWTDNFAEIFYNAYHYRLEPYYPFIFYTGTEGYPKTKYTDSFMDEIKRVRYDYNCLLSTVFLENFTTVFHAFCRENGLKSRYQAYGWPLHMNMMGGYLIPDIPEGNNWLNSPWSDIENKSFDWDQTRGDKIWNLYAASAARHAGKKVVSCEAMTCTNNVFGISLETIKAHDDMNFISGINHSVLHGFNYSPPEAGFPGWVRFGTYFSEQNTWWPYINLWVDYNARLSYVFQECHPEKTWAVLPPEGDCWSINGLVREPFHTQPWYCFRLWESFSQVGSSLEYINEKLLQGNFSYEGIILCDVQSISPKTASILKRYVQEGGKLVYINQVPSRSLSMVDRHEGDMVVRGTFDTINSKYADRVYLAEVPANSDDLLSWSANLLKNMGIPPDVYIDKPNRGVYQIHSTYKQKDIYFFVNALRNEEVDFKAVFPTGKKIPWIWEPEKGTRRQFPVSDSFNKLSIHLGPLESMLLVFEPHESVIPFLPFQQQIIEHTSSSCENSGHILVPVTPWELKFQHINGKRAECTFAKLIDFSGSDDKFLRSFAGKVEYKTTFEAEGNEKEILLGSVNKGIAEIYINGRIVGIKWYGTPCFNVEGLVRKGSNMLKIKYTTILNNYCLSLKDNPIVYRWMQGRSLVSCGLTGDIILF